MPSMPFTQEMLERLAKLSPEERREKYLLFYLLGKIPNRRTLEIRDRFSEQVAPEESSAWLPFSRPDPTTFGREVLGLKPSAKQLEYGLDWLTPDQQKIHDAILLYKRVLVKSCNGGGKTWDDALVAHWAYNSGFRTLITASTLAQADAGVGAEVQKLRALGPPGMGGKWMPSENHANYTKLHELLTFSVKIGTEEEIAGSAAGRHYKRMCLIIDEANSVSAKLIEQVDRICLNPNDIVVATMNATPPNCYMRKAADKTDVDGNPLWHVVTIDGENHPNVIYDDPDIIPGAITRDFIKDQLGKAGGNKKHFMYAPPVKGEYADFSSDGLIQRPWIDRAMARWEANNRKSDYRGTAIGADIAGAGGDASSIWKMTDWRLDRPIIFQDFCNKAMAMEHMPTVKPGPAWLRNREVKETNELLEAVIHTTPDVRGVAIDATGIGQAPISYLNSPAVRKRLPVYLKHVPHHRLMQMTEEHKPDVVGYNAQQSPEAKPVKEKFKKFKDQCLWFMARALENDQFDIPPKRVWDSWGLHDVDIMEELLRPVWGVDSTGHIIVATKRGDQCADEDMAKRCHEMPAASPNELDGMALTLWQFAKLTPGQKPIETAKELLAQEKESILKRERQKYAQRGKQTRGKLPWHLAR